MRFERKGRLDYRSVSLNSMRINDTLWVLSVPKLLNLTLQVISASSQMRSRPIWKCDIASDFFRNCCAIVLEDNMVLANSKWVLVASSFTICWLMYSLSATAVVTKLCCPRLEKLSSCCRDCQRLLRRRTLVKCQRVRLISFLILCRFFFPIVSISLLGTYRRLT